LIRYRLLDPTEPTVATVIDCADDIHCIAVAEEMRQGRAVQIWRGPVLVAEWNAAGQLRIELQGDAAPSRRGGRSSSGADHSLRYYRELLARADGRSKAEIARA